MFKRRFKKYSKDSAERLISSIDNDIYNHIQMLERLQERPELKEIFVELREALSSLDNAQTALRYALSKLRGYI